jgi:hypothetical protein
MTMAKNNNINADYLHEKGSINIFIENMQRMSELGTTGTIDIVEMLSTLINLLTEIIINNNNSSTANILLEDFKNGLGYHFLVDFCLKLEQNVEELDSLQKLISLILQFTKVGSSELKPRPLSVNHLFIMEDFSMPRPSTKNAIRNMSAFNVYQTLWTRCKTQTLQDLILDALINVYKEDKANYFILDSQNTLSQFTENLQLKAPQIQVIFVHPIHY